MSEQRFTITNEHLTLLHAANVGWHGDEFGAPAIDCKRPYGNGDVHRDMAKLLGREMPLDEWGEWEPEPELLDELNRLHAETQTALQIILTTGWFQPGEYVASKYGRDWRPVLPNPVSEGVR